MTILYGIRSCDTAKRARGWLDAHSVTYHFHDYKTAGVPPEELRRWVDELGWERVLNRNGTTFRRLDDSERAGLDAGSATKLMLAHPSAIRRPIVVAPGVLLAGFDADTYIAAGLTG